MFAKFRDWLDARSSYRKLMAALLLEHIPGGAKWRYVWGSTLSFVFFIQLVTGVLLMTAYSPSANSAWSSVYFIQYEMDFGWFIRGLHHFGSQTMVVLLAVHMLQVVIAGAHLPPREVNWWLGLLLMGAILGLSLTGYLLPWDQKGYWATGVATNIASTLPLLGPYLQKFAVGGPEYGNATLTRFFALHVAILPPLVIVLIIAHIAVFRKQGITTVEPKDHPKQGIFWPDQVFKDLIACLVVFGVMVSLVVFGGHGNGIPAETHSVAEAPGLYEDWAKAGRKGMGANLDAPADQDTEHYPARPEWYFLFLFQLLKYFKGDQMIIGTMAIPQGAGLLLFLLPLLGIGRMRKFGHVVGVVVVVSLIADVGSLTCLALADDTLEPVGRELLTLIAKWVIPLIGGVFLLYLAILAILPRGVFRGLVNALGVIVLAVLVGGTGLLIYAAQEDDKLREERDEGKLTRTEEQEQRQLPLEVRDIVQKEMKKNLDRETQQEAKDRETKQHEIEKFHHELKEAKEVAARAVLQASRGIPAEGPIALVRNDPLTRGRKLFGVNCASCHSYTNPTTGQAEFPTPKDGFTASDLGGFGSKKWILGLIEHADGDKYFGRIIQIVETKNKLEPKKQKRLPTLNTMADWSAERREEREAYEKKLKEPNLDAAEKALLEKKLKRNREEFDLIATWLAKQPTADIPDAKDQGEFARGYQAFKQNCAECHRYQDKGGQSGPNLTGYGSPEWVRLMMMFPTSPERYPKKNLMPAFRNLDGPGADVYEQQFKLLHQDRKVEVVPLNDIQRELILRFLLQDERVVFGGRPIGGPPKKE